MLLYGTPGCTMCGHDIHQGPPHDVPDEILVCPCRCHDNYRLVRCLERGQLEQVDAT